MTNKHCINLSLASLQDRQSRTYFLPPNANTWASFGNFFVWLLQLSGAIKNDKIKSQYKNKITNYYKATALYNIYSYYSYHIIIFILNMKVALKSLDIINILLLYNNILPVF